MIVAAIKLKNIINVQKTQASVPMTCEKRCLGPQVCGVYRRGGAHALSRGFSGLDLGFRHEGLGVSVIFLPR